MSNTFGSEVDPQVNYPSMSGHNSDAGTPLKEKASQKMHAAGAAVKETTHQVTSKAKEMTRDATEELKSQSREFAQSRKNQIGERIKGSGEAIRRAADKLRSEDDPNLSHYAQAVAEKVERAGDYIRSKDMREIRRDLEIAARQRPELVFGGLFVAGLVLARFLKASTPEVRDRADYSAEYTGYNRPAADDRNESERAMSESSLGTSNPYTPAVGNI